eukprot:13870593-Alexandrium_andersonii.AAC.1
MQSIVLATRRARPDARQAARETAKALPCHVGDCGENFGRVMTTPETHPVRHATLVLSPPSFI